MFAVMLGGAIWLSPAFIKEVLNAGPDALGMLRAAPALGAIPVGIWLAIHSTERGPNATGSRGFGLC